MRKNPHEPFKIDAKFGVPVSYGPHEGWDTNGLGGGNTDCNTPLFPLVVDYAKAIFQSFSTAGYGRMLIYEVGTPRGPRWIRYAHLNAILCKNGDILHTDRQVAKMGSTGNSTHCHLHWDIFKKKPPATNWRWYPKNKTELNEYMIDPQEFINVYGDYKPTTPKEESPQEPMPEDALEACMIDRKNFWAERDAARREVEELNTKIKAVEISEQTAKRNESEAKKNYDDLVLEIVEKLNPVKPLPGVTDKNLAMTLLDDIIKVESEQRKIIKTQETAINGHAKKLKDQADQYEAQLADLREELAEMKALHKKEIKDLQTKHQEDIEDLEKRFTKVETNIETNKAQIDATNVFSTFISKLLAKAPWQKQKKKSKA